MYGRFLIKSRHETTYYFRRRVPDYARSVIGKAVLLRSLQTTDHRLAMTRSHSLGARTDAIFIQIDMAKKNGTPDDIRFDLSIRIDFGVAGSPPSLKITDDDPERINAYIRAFSEAMALPRSSEFRPVHHHHEVERG